MPKSAIDILKADHKKVLGLLTELEETTTRASKKRTKLLAEIEHELLTHTTIEEEIFYPAFKGTSGKENKKIYFEALEEHRAVEKLVLPDLKKSDVGSEQFSGRAKVLKELVEHHAEEEEKEMFPKARKALTEDELLELGQRMADRKTELQVARLL